MHITTSLPPANRLLTGITSDTLISLLDKKYEIHYVDYRYNLDDATGKIQEQIHDPENWALAEAVNDCWLMDGEDYFFEEFFKGFKSEISDLIEYDADEFDGDLDTDEQVAEILAEYEDEIRETVQDRDVSNPLKQMIRNTSEQVFFYDIDSDIGDYTNDLDENVKDIKRALGIKIRDKTYDTKLEELTENASYGGKLVVYFYDDIDDWITSTYANTIAFKDPHIAIVDHWNGSGHDVQLDGFEVEFPFNRQNLFLDKEVKYNYTYDVCNAASDWCGGTGVNLKITRRKQTLSNSTLNEKILTDRKLDKTYRDGGCTSGDMNIKRHRGPKYINSFPCGLKCPNCGTFWID